MEYSCVATFSKKNTTPNVRKAWRAISYLKIFLPISQMKCQNTCLFAEENVSLDGQIRLSIPINWPEIFICRILSSTFRKYQDKAMHILACLWENQAKPGRRWYSSNYTHVAFGGWMIMASSRWNILFSLSLRNTAKNSYLTPIVHI